ncbi:MAG: glutathione S-transferase family protein [Pseudomonadales bacterium]|jgi:glutathione S-transferase|nr:glutathione S-transferase family protein [Pseudomonadales bacterium]
MKYVTVEEGRNARGLRLVLSQGVPGPWGEAAKAMFRVKGLDYLAIAQEGGGENAALRDWTGQVSAPVAVWDDEPPRTDSLDILFLAERLAPTPRLIPEDVEQRVRMFGIAREIIGRRGLGWMRRIMIFTPIIRSGKAPDGMRNMATRYGYRDELAQSASSDAARILAFLAATLERQQARGSRYFVGDTLTAADIYWAAFSNIVSPMPTENCPMPEWLRGSYADVGPVVAAALKPILLEHRDFVFAEHIGLPMDFLATA